MKNQIEVDEKNKGVYVDVVMVDIIFLSLCFAVSFIPFFNIILTLFTMVYLEIGVWGFALRRQRNESVIYEDIFIGLKLFVKSLCVKIIKMVVILLWSLLFIIPGVIMALNYAFTGLITYESKEIDAKGILQLSHELTNGYKFKIFTVFLISLLSVCLAMSIPFGILKLISMFTPVVWWVYVILISVCAGVAFLLVAFPLYQLSIADYYNASKLSKGKF